MGLGNNVSGGAPIENPQGKVERGSNLSETAKFVKPYLDRITEVLREMNLVAKANELIGKNLPAQSPEAIDFAVACRKAQSQVIESLRKEKGEDPKGEAVVSNYFTKLLVTFPSESPVAPLAPQVQPPHKPSEDSLLVS